MDVLFLALLVGGPILGFTLAARLGATPIRLIAAATFSGAAGGTLFATAAMARASHLAVAPTLIPWVLIFIVIGFRIGVSGVAARLLGSFISRT